MYKVEFPGKFIEQIFQRKTVSHWGKFISHHTDSMDMNLSKPQERVEGRGAWHFAVLRVTKSDTT